MSAEGKLVNQQEDKKKEMEENRRKLAEKFGTTKMGSTLARRKHKNVHQTQVPSIITRRSMTTRSSSRLSRSTACSPSRASTR